MFRYFHLVLFFICTVQTTNGLSIQPKVVNGTDATDGKYPYAVSVRYFGYHECGGSIIGDRWILTAAHCIYSSLVSNATVLYGTVHLQNGESPESYTAKVIQLIQHDRYTALAPSYENDIGLIKLKEPLQFNDRVQPVNLAESVSPTPAGESGVLVGWGYEIDNGSVPEILQQVELMIYSDVACFEAHHGEAQIHVHLCAGYPEGGKGQCTGDSGGPLTVNGTQYGIVSWSVKPCAVAGYPGVYSKVSTYRQWIYNKTGI
ncbi:chymotrypsin-2-like [Onthophagus taurus]|uniref:chymotrypsin-2-like n=1 Tax=Onthophagus taurus TaxID=166361 RepID=UPI000C20A897|nr:chymotrypsin-2-like [Onthophagus taurus]